MSNNKQLHAITRRSKLIDAPDGTHVEIFALTLADFAFIQEEAASAARRELMNTYRDCPEVLAMLPEAQKAEAIRDALKRAEEIRTDTISAERVNLWLTKSLKGRLCAIWRSMLPARPGLTYDEAAALWSNAGAGEQKINEAAQEVGNLSRPTLGNASPPPAKPEAEGAMGA